jgi:hypothetical protein
MDEQISENIVINKKYATIVLSSIITALIVGVGVFMWQQDVVNQVKSSALQEKQLLEQQVLLIQKQLLALQGNDGQDLNDIDNTGVKVEIVNGTKFCSDTEYPDVGYQKILKAIYPNGTEKILYSTSKTEESENKCLLSQGICCLKLSPNGKYLIFSKTGWEWSKTYMINIETEQYVFGDNTEVSDIYNIKNVNWSADNNNFAITTSVNELGAVGEMGVYVSAYNNPDKIKKIWTAKNYLLTEIKNISFIGNDKLRIEIELSENENSPKKSNVYEYDFKLDKLEMVK